MAERVDTDRVGGLFQKVHAFLLDDAFRNGDDDGIFLLEKCFDVLQALSGVKGQFRQINEIHAVAVGSVDQRSRAGEPARVSAHDLDDRDHFHVIDAGVLDDFLRGDRHVLRRGAEARGVVRDGQVVVDGLRNTDKADVRTDQMRVVRHLGNGVHRVIAADVEEILDVQALQASEQLLVDLISLFDGRKFISAGTQIARRRALQKLDVDGIRKDRIQIDVAAVQEALDAVAHAVHGPEAKLFRLRENACQTGVDDCGGTAGLADDHISHESFFVHK